MEEQRTLRLQALANSLDHVEARLEAFTSSPKQEVMASLTGLDKAKFNVAMAYTLSSLYYVLLKTKGLPTEGHDVRTELQRVAKCLQLVKRKATEISDLSEVGSIDKDPQPEQKRLRLNAEAGRRIVERTIKTNSAMAAPVGGPNVWGKKQKQKRKDKKTVFVGGVGAAKNRRGKPS